MASPKNLNEVTYKENFFRKITLGGIVRELLDAAKRHSAISLDVSVESEVLVGRVPRWLCFGASSLKYPIIPWTVPSKNFTVSIL